MLAAGAGIFFGICCIITMVLWGMSGLLGFAVWGEVSTAPACCMTDDPTCAVLPSIYSAPVLLCSGLKIAAWQWINACITYPELKGRMLSKAFAQICEGPSSESLAAATT